MTEEHHQKPFTKEEVLAMPPMGPMVLDMYRMLATVEELQVLKARAVKAELLIVMMRGAAALVKFEWEKQRSPGYGQRMYYAALTALQMSDENMPALTDKFSALFEQAAALRTYLLITSPMIKSRAEFINFSNALDALEES